MAETEGLRMIVEKELDYVAFLDPSTNRVKAAAAAVERLEALNPQIWAYFASLEFQGNQIIDVLVDTGSAGMGVPVQAPSNWSAAETTPFVSLDLGKARAETVLCRDPRCRGACDAPGKDHFCSPKGGSCRTAADGTDVCTFAWLYGDGSSASGTLVTSRIGMAGLEVQSTYGAIDTASNNFYEAPHGGGIMGLSFGGYTLCDAEYSCFPPLFDSFVEQLKIPNKFAICHDGMNGGEMILGGGNTNMYDGELKRAPMQAPFGFYSVGIENVTLGGTQILPPGNTQGTRLRGGSYLENGKVSAVVDTGNSALYMPEPIFNNFRSGLLTALSKWPELSDKDKNLFTGYAVYIPPEILSELPPLALTLEGGAVLSMPAEQYTVEFRIPEAPVPIRALKIIKSNRFVLGQTVLSRSYLEIDRDGKTVGFAPSKPGCPA